MIPILYESNETAFTNNGLGRLRDCISCVVTEERNGIYECDFEYPIGGVNYDLIKIGRIICVSHDASMIAKPRRSSGTLTDEAEDILTDENGIALTASRTIFGTDYDVQPFDIVSFTRPIDGIVTFHCVHVSYRQSYMTVTGSNINSLANALSLLSSAEPTNPFTYQTDKASTGYLASADGVPKSVRSMLGGIEGSILDAYGGEYEWDRFNVILHSARGTFRDFSIRYGVNMLDYNEELDSSGTYMSCVPYWTDGTTTIVGDRQISNGSTITGRGECVPLDVSEKFENQPTKAEVEAMGLSVMNASNPMIPAQTISVEFVRLQDMGFEWLEKLYDCRLCDTIKVVFPFYDTVGQFKIVKTVWDVLSDRYESMELGDLSITLSEALGISSESSRTADMTDFVVEQGTSSIWSYRKWNNGTMECWCAYTASIAVTTASAGYGGYRSGSLNIPTFPVTFTSAPVVIATVGSAGGVWVNNVHSVTTTGGNFYLSCGASSAATNRTIFFYVIGK